MRRIEHLEYLTVKEAAALVRVHYRTMYKFIKKGVVAEQHGLCRRTDRQYLIKEAPFRRVFIEGKAPSGRERSK